MKRGGAIYNINFSDFSSVRTAGNVGLFMFEFYGQIYLSAFRLKFYSVFNTKK